MTTPHYRRAVASCVLALALAVPGLPAHADTSSTSSDSSTSSLSSVDASSGSSASGGATPTKEEARHDYDTALAMWRFYFRTGGFHDRNTADECRSAQQWRDKVDGSAVPPAPTCTNEVADTLLMLALGPIAALSSEFTLFSLLNLFFPGR